jgi:signal transduction histidine kinase
MKNIARKKRLRYLINRNLQLGLAVRFMVIFLLFTLFMFFEAYMTFWPVVTVFVPAATLSAVTDLVITRLIYFSIPIVFVILGIVIVLTHRIAGPLYRIKKTLNELIDGKDATPISLRRNDELKDLTELINRLIPLLKKGQKE